MSTLQRRVGKYELQERLGSRGMTEIWKGLDTHLQRLVAIKVLHANLQHDPDFIKRFEREARVVASLHHPNIVQVHDFQISRSPESESTNAYMVMEYVAGPTLADYISNTSRMGRFPSPTQIVQLFASISAAIDYAHRKGVLHLNLKPANILLDQRNTTRHSMGEPILTDFGVTKLLGASTSMLSGSWISMPLYISPEQAQGQPGNERSDLYSLGIILYEICTGILPFRGEKPSEILQQHINTMPTAPNLINPNISPALSAVILRCLAKDPAARFPNASSMTNALAEALNLPLPDSIDPVPMTPKNSLIDLSPQQPRPSIGSIPSTPVIPPTIVGTPASPTPSSTSRQALPTSSAQTPSVSHVSSPPVTPMVAVPPSLTRRPKKRWKGWVVALLILLLLVLVGSVLGSLFLLPHGNAVITTTFSGSAFFGNSGQLDEDSSQGLNDELQIDLQNVPVPHAGKSYYAWLLGDWILNDDKNSSPSTMPAPVLLGTVPVNNGTVRFHYSHPQHINLLAITSRLLITEEDTNSKPSTPASNHRDWRYYAEIAQLSPTASPQTVAESQIGSLRHLLCDGPQLLAVGIHGGSAIQLLRSTQKVLEWASSGRDAWNGAQTKDTDFIRRQAIRVLENLDGATLIKSDAPPGTPLLIELVKLQHPLLGVEGGTPRSYIERVRTSMQDIISDRHASPETHGLAKQIYDDLDNVARLLEQVRQDAKQLIVLDKTALPKPSTLTLLNDMQTNADFALVGQIDPATQKVQGGVVNIYNTIQHLAKFDIKPY